MSLDGNIYLHKVFQPGYWGVCSAGTAFLIGVSRFYLSIVSLAG